MTTRNLEPDQLRKGEKWRLVSGRRRQLLKEPDRKKDYYYYYSTWMSLLTGLFFQVLLLNQRWSPTLRLQASHCSTFRIMCDVRSIGVFCSESIERFPGTASKFFLGLLLTTPVAPIITGIIVHFRFHISCISIHKPFYLNFFSASFCTTFLSAGIATSISVILLLLLLLLLTHHHYLTRDLLCFITYPLHH